MQKKRSTFYGKVRSVEVNPNVDQFMTNKFLRVVKISLFRLKGRLVGAQKKVKPIVFLLTS